MSRPDSAVAQWDGSYDVNYGSHGDGDGDGDGMEKDKAPREVLAINLCQVALARLKIRVGTTTAKKA